MNYYVHINNEATATQQHTHAHIEIVKWFIVIVIYFICEMTFQLISNDYTPTCN